MMFLAQDPADKDVAQLDSSFHVLTDLLTGKSAIDLTQLAIHDREEAYQLVNSYGFDLNRDEDALEIQAYLLEAIDFIERRLLSANVDWAALGEPPSPASRIPAEAIASRNVLDLILMASDMEHPMRHWACAILKVMHTLVYIHNSPLYKYQGPASETILERFQKVLRKEENGSYTLLGRTRELPLYGFEIKWQKPRESILIKLLCKKENVAEDIWDLVGIRLITNHLNQALSALDILREQKVILLPNVIPGRTRNSLIDFDLVRQQYETAMGELKAGKRSLEEMRQFLETMPVSPTENTEAGYNPSSSPSYRSLQITCRQLLRIRPPGTRMEMRFAFPYEIQIQDKDSYLENRDGHSAHALYKQRQLIAARRRVLGFLLTEKPATEAAL